MSMSEIGVLQSPRADWAEIFAFAWQNGDPVLTDLRKDPKKAIEDLARGEYGATSDTREAAEGIIRQTEDQPLETYSGYIPIPRPPLNDLSRLSEEDLAGLLNLGLDGVLKFNLQAELWAKVLLEAWRDEDILKAIRQDPLTGLRRILDEDQISQLLDSDYGILPLPNLPNGLDKLEMEDLVAFLGDELNAEHLGGIFLVAT